MNQPKLRPGISKYFIALVPPQPVYEISLEWKNYFKSEFNAKAALNSPPHITLHMPFEWKATKEELLKHELKKYAAHTKPFSIQLSNFGCFPPRVIFINVVAATPLSEMQAALHRFCKVELSIFNANRWDQPYHPHLTVAFRDLKKKDFPIAWAAVEDVELKENFSVDEMALLKHNGLSWEVLTAFKLEA